MTPPEINARKVFGTMIAAKYEKIRTTLSPTDQPYFDEAMALLQKLLANDSELGLILDGAISYGLAAIALSPIARAQMLPMLARSLALALQLDQEVKANGSSYSN